MENHFSIQSAQGLLASIKKRPNFVNNILDKIIGVNSTKTPIFS